MASSPIVKVVAICGSLRKDSYHKGLVRAAIELSKSIDGMEIEYVDISELPLLNTDLIVNGAYPPAVEAVRQKIRAADSILIASPEYNYSIAAPMKNAVDWASLPPNSFADKPAAMISSGGSLGGGRAQYHLRQVGVFVDLHFINKPEFYVYAKQPPVKFDAEGNLIHEETRQKLKELLLSLYQFTLRLQGRSAA